ncbi:hypothetical protein PF007_g12017 [Phytophthora fragariae]|uniref:Uncharacterized protein n=2 Tax=Phytophthora fragariae TaxID=53985 RepID=A0A6A3SAZ4_9STRA|nr:hypothetical protein PF007_g12017 [Phytophthora fragariae]
MTMLAFEDGAAKVQDGGEGPVLVRMQVEMQDDYNAAVEYAQTCAQMACRAATPRETTALKTRRSYGRFFFIRSFIPEWSRMKSQASKREAAAVEMCKLPRHNEGRFSQKCFKAHELLFITQETNALHP